MEVFDHDESEEETFEVEAEGIVGQNLRMKPRLWVRVPQREARADFIIDSVDAKSVASDSVGTADSEVDFSGFDGDYGVVSTDSENPKYELLDSSRSVPPSLPFALYYEFLILGVPHVSPFWFSLLDSVAGASQLS